MIITRPEIYTNENNNHNSFKLSEFLWSSLIITNIWLVLLSFYFSGFFNIYIVYDNHLLHGFLMYIIIIIHFFISFLSCYFVIKPCIRSRYSSLWLSEILSRFSFFFNLFHLLFITYLWLLFSNCSAVGGVPVTWKVMYQTSTLS